MVCARISFPPSGGDDSLGGSLAHRTVTRTRYNAAGAPLISRQKQMISSLSSSIESKSISGSERNLTSAQWVEYHNGTKRKSYNTLPTSNITAEAVSVDGFTLSQTDNAGVTTTNTRSYTANGMIHTHTDGRGNTTTTVTDIAGRTLTVTDAAGNVTTTAYDPAHDLPATVTDAQGNTSCYRYDVRGYLQITCCDLNRSNLPALWFITWEPTQPIATRPLAIQKDGTWYSAPARLASQDSRSQECSRLGGWLLKSHPAYGWDLTKNICELYGSNGYFRTAYTYTPYGEVTESANISEVDRSKLGKEIARKIPVTIPEIVWIRIGCCMLYDVPDTELKVNIELANKDRDYISDLVALRVERNNPFIDLDYAKKKGSRT